MSKTIMVNEIELLKQLIRITNINENKNYKLNIDEDKWVGGYEIELYDNKKNIFGIVVSNNGDNGYLSIFLSDFEEIIDLSEENKKFINYICNKSNGDSISFSRDELRKLTNLYLNDKNNQINSKYNREIRIIIKDINKTKYDDRDEIDLSLGGYIDQFGNYYTYNEPTINFDDFETALLSHFFNIDHSTLTMDVKKTLIDAFKFIKVTDSTYKDIDECIKNSCNEKQLKVLRTIININQYKNSDNIKQKINNKIKELKNVLL